jgi:hypothetical protein
MPWPIPLVRNNQTTLFPMSLRKIILESRREISNSPRKFLSSPLERGRKRGKNHLTPLHPTTPNLRNNFSKKGGKKFQLNFPLLSI